MLVVDAQVHLWAANTPQRPWYGHPHREVPLGVDELLGVMDAAGVQGAILVPPSIDGNRNDLVLQAALRYPNRFAVMGRLDMQSPRSRRMIAGWCKQPGMLGLRCAFSRPQSAPILTEGRVEWLWEEAEKAGVPIMALVTPSMLRLVDDIAERHPGLKLALCHLALEGGKRDDAAFRDFDRLAALARRPNISVKVSALPLYTNDNYPYRRLHPYLRRVYEAFGAQRMFWGTDYSRLTCSYRQAMTMFTQEIPWLSSTDLEWIMGRALCEWLGWQLPAA